MASQKTELENYVTSVKTALDVFALNTLYIKNIYKSIASPKDQAFITKQYAHFETKQKILFTYLQELNPSHTTSPEDNLGKRNRPDGLEFSSHSNQFKTTNHCS